MSTIDDTDLLVYNRSTIAIVEANLPCQLMKLYETFEEALVRHELEMA